MEGPDFDNLISPKAEPLEEAFTPTPSVRNNMHKPKGQIAEDLQARDRTPTKKDSL